MYRTYLYHADQAPYGKLFQLEDDGPAVEALKDKGWVDTPELLKYDQEGVATSTPGGPDVQALADAIESIDPEDRSLWTKGGAPTVEALEAASGIADLTAQDRNQAWLVHTARNDA